jgi:3-hydroxybutyryl-CoA dehydrogenase
MRSIERTDAPMMRDCRPSGKDFDEEHTRTHETHGVPSHLLAKPRRSALCGQSNHPSSIALPAGMPFDLSSTDLPVGVIGAGAMGRGIAQVLAQCGCRVLLHDTNAAAIDAAVASVAAVLGKQVDKGKLDATRRDATLARLIPAHALSDFASCALVVEAIVENLDVKRKLFAQIETIVAADAVLVSNTSSLSITAIAAQCAHPSRVAGWHFFNPVPLMKVAEVVDGLATDRAVGDALMALTKRLGHTPVRAKDTPGFIVNHAGRGYGTEALRIVGEGICDFADVDRVMREAAGFRLGPFELMDLTALDVSHPVMEAIYRQYYDEPRFRPSVITAQRLAGGRLGRKTKGGFYEYGDDAVPVVEARAPIALPASVWVSRAHAHAQSELTWLLEKMGATVEAGEVPSDEALIIVTPLGSDATTSAIEEGLDPERTVAIDTLVPLALRRTLMTTPVTRPDVREEAHGLFASDGVAVTVIGDSPGFIAQRILATIVNIACDIAQQKIATPADIDLAVRLGLNYPNGPLAMGDALGPTKLLTILRAMQEFYGDPRYRPSPWLTRRALLGISLTTPAR